MVLCLELSSSRHQCEMEWVGSRQVFEIQLLERPSSRTRGASWCHNALVQRPEIPFTHGFLYPILYPVYVFEACAEVSSNYNAYFTYLVSP